MAARKPSSVFIFTHNPNHEQIKDGAPTTWTCHRIPLDGKEPQPVVEEFLKGKTPGLEVAWVSDTNVTALVLDVAVKPVDDIRLVAKA